MKKITAIASTILLGCATLCAAQPDTTVVFTVSPRMTCANCEKKITSNLRFEKGVKKIETSVPDRTVKVTYNPAKTNVEAIKKGFKKVGYTATEVKK